MCSYNCNTFIHFFNDLLKKYINMQISNYDDTLHFKYYTINRTHFTHLQNAISKFFFECKYVFNAKKMQFGQVKFTVLWPLWTVYGCFVFIPFCSECNSTFVIKKMKQKVLNQIDVPPRPLSSMENLSYGWPVFCPLLIPLLVLK